MDNGREMQAERRRRWVEALRSGRFNQGKGALAVWQGKDTFEYCCLGVACVVALEDEDRGFIMERRWNEFYTAHLEEAPQFGSDDWPGEDSELPPLVAHYFGLLGSDGTFGDRSLISLNDDDGYTFEEIADVIEGSEFSERGVE